MLPTTPTPVKIETDDITLLAVIGSIQLALSHPQFNGPAAKAAKFFVDGVTPHLAKISPVYQIIIEAGWHQRSGS